MPPIPTPKPAPSPEPTPASPPTPGSEQDTTDPQDEAVYIKNIDTPSVTVSGKEIDELIAVNPEYVTFIEDGLRVSVPSVALKDLDLDAGDTLTVNLEETDSGNIEVTFEINGQVNELSADEPVLTDAVRDSSPTTTTDNGEEITSTKRGRGLLFIAASVIGLSGVGAFVVMRMKAVRR